MGEGGPVGFGVKAALTAAVCRGAAGGVDVGGPSEVPADVDEVGEVVAFGVGVVLDDGRGESCGAVAGGLGGLGGILGQVGRHLALGQFAVSGVDTADVDLLAPCDQLLTSLEPEGGEYDKVFPGLAGVVLEDSWVLDVDVCATVVVFTLDAVLTPEHPAYRLARPGEMHCYRRAMLTVRSDAAVHVRRSLAPPARDAAGELDYGHIDTLQLAVDHGPEVWELTGAWGEALVRQPRIDLRFEAPTHG